MSLLAKKRREMNPQSDEKTKKKALKLKKRLFSLGKRRTQWTIF
jgi:hypothetical protein